MAGNLSATTQGCAFCGSARCRMVLDLGMSPLCESYVSEERLNEMEPFYPLHMFVCEDCFLVQLEEYVSPRDIFTEYAYFSSYSDSWLQHMQRYSSMILDRLKLNSQSFVVEIGSNDGYLLQYFTAKRIPSLGIEPSANVARRAVEKGVPTLVEFFDAKLAERLVAEGKQADLIAGANVLAQVPNINDFVEGIKVLLKPHGVVTIEFPHLMRLIEGNQFDTIYHEHFYYFSFLMVEKIFAAHELKIFDVEEISTHGGSLRIYGCHRCEAAYAVADRVAELKGREERIGCTRLDWYFSFAERVKEAKRKLLEFLIAAKCAGKTIVGYGAPGKGNTLLNYCGIRTDFLEYVVDRNPYKQGKFLPGTHIPIHHPETIKETKPDYVLILPWNLKDEVMEQNAYVREWGGRFVVPIPEVKAYS